MRDLLATTLSYLSFLLIAVALGVLTFGIIDPASVDSFSWSYPSGSSKVNLLSAGAVVHYSYNSFVALGFDRFILNFANTISLILPDVYGNGIAVLLGCIFCSGLALLLSYLSGSRSFKELISAALFTAVVLLLWGRDHLLLSCLAPLPWFVLSLLLAGRNKRSSLLAMLFVAIVSIVAVRISASFSVFVFIAGATLWFLLAQSFGALNRLTENFQKVLICLCVVLPLFVGLELRQELVFPDYPVNSHVVTDDNVPGQIVPLVGEASNVSFVDRVFVRSKYGPASVLLLALVVLLIAPVYAKKKEALGLCYFSLICALGVFLDTGIEESLAQIMPLNSMARIVAGTTFYPLSALFFAFALIGVLFVAQRMSSAFTILFLGCLVLGLAVQNSISHSTPFEKVAAARVSEGLKQLPVEKVKELTAIVFSPSYNVLLTEGLEALLNESILLEASKNEYPLAINSSREINPPQVFDNDLATRWTSEILGAQVGTEEFCLSFEEEVSLSGIEISPGQFFSDFPRGIEILKVKDCEDDSGELVYRRPHWEGPLRFSTNGYPYWGWQADVEIRFPSEVYLRNLKVRQIGKNSNFDWSVAEISFFGS